MRSSLAAPSITLIKHRAHLNCARGHHGVRKIDLGEPQRDTYKHGNCLRDRSNTPNYIVG